MVNKKLSTMKKTSLQISLLNHFNLVLVLPVKFTTGRSASGTEEVSNVNSDINSNPGGYKKGASPGGIKFISTSISEERG